MAKLINITDGLAEGVEMVTQYGTARIGTGTKRHLASREFNPTTKAAGKPRVYCSAGSSRSSRMPVYVHQFTLIEDRAERIAAITCGSC